MKQYKGTDEYYLIIKTDFANKQKIEELLNKNNDIEGSFDYHSIVLNSCPKCGDNEFWNGGMCGHCGYYYRD